MITTSAPLLSLLVLVPLSSAWRLTPLTIDQHPCKPEKLKAQSRYICDSDGNVKCLTGWKDKDYNKDPHFPCAEPICNPKCLNGECKLPNVCVCEVGWDGLDCGTCIDMPGCVNGGCIKTDENGDKKGEPLTCNCKDNWQGALCDVPKCPAEDSDDNSKPDCNNNGICVDTAEEKHECKCNLGWGGSTCQDCKSLMGCKDKNTIDVDGDNEGDGCKVMVQGQVEQKPNSCQCTKHWKGIFCEQPRCLATDGETEITCVHGKCKQVDGVEGAFCHCNVGWMGEKCDQCMPQDGCPERKSGDPIAACVLPNECRCQGSAADATEETKKCTVWIAEGKCGDNADCGTDEPLCAPDTSVPADPLAGTCREPLGKNECLPANGDKDCVNAKDDDEKPLPLCDESSGKCVDQTTKLTCNNNSDCDNAGLSDAGVPLTFCNQSSDGTVSQCCANFMDVPGDPGVPCKDGALSR